MEKERFSGSQQLQLKESGPSTARHEHGAPGPRAPVADGKKRKTKKITDPAESRKVVQVPLASPQQRAPVLVKKQLLGGSHCSSELSSNSSIGRTANTVAVVSSSSLETEKPPCKSPRHSEQISTQAIANATNERAVPSSLKLQLKSGNNAKEDKSLAEIGTRESLRWDGQCSDEERERERIEEYKRHRRKRYAKHFAGALQQKSHPSPFYTSSQSPQQ